MNPRKIAVLNQKGGAGKSTVTANLAVAWAAQPLQRRVLVVDLDAQRNLSTMLGVVPERLARTIYDVFVGESALADVIVGQALALPSESDRQLGLVPGDARMKDLEATMIVQERREEFLDEYLDGHVDDFDVVLFDCPPNLGTLTVNAIYAADEAIVPVAMNDMNAYAGAADLLSTLERLRRRRIEIDVRCLIRNEADHRRNAYATLNSALADLEVPVARTEIPKRAAIEDGAILGVPVAASRPDSPGGAAFYRLAEELDTAPDARRLRSAA